ncbi:hypothetical protein ACX0G9_05140 [Flavitalea flava]
METIITETTTFDKDIKVFYKTAKSFPDGALEAHQSLHALVPFSKERKYFGISRPENGTIVYRAATEETVPGEGEKLGCQTMILKKGKYMSTVIHDYMKDISSIGQTFQQMIESPEIDPQGYCVEWYISDKDVKCMIRLAD